MIAQVLGTIRRLLRSEIRLVDPVITLPTVDVAAALIRSATIQATIARFAADAAIREGQLRALNHDAPVPQLPHVPTRDGSKRYWVGTDSDAGETVSYEGDDSDAAYAAWLALDHNDTANREFWDGMTRRFPVAP